jgi:hypothetical protein
VSATEQNGAQLYTAQGIAIGTLLGSLAAGAVLLWLNYRALGYHALANKVAAAGFLVYAVIIVVASALPDEPVLGLVFMALQTGLAYWLAWVLQGDAIAYHQAQGGALHSNFRAAAVGLLAGLAVVVLLLVISSALNLPILS